MQMESLTLNCLQPKVADSMSISIHQLLIDGTSLLQTVSVTLILLSKGRMRLVYWYHQQSISAQSQLFPKMLISSCWKFNTTAECAAMPMKQSWRSTTNCFISMCFQELQQLQLVPVNVLHDTFSAKVSMIVNSKLVSQSPPKWITYAPNFPNLHRNG